MTILKRILVGSLLLFGLVVLISMIKLSVPILGKIVGAAAVLLGGAAMIRPIPKLGLGNRLFSAMVAFWVGGIGLVAEPSDPVEPPIVGSGVDEHVEDAVAEPTDVADKTSDQIVVVPPEPKEDPNRPDTEQQGLVPDVPPESPDAPVAHSRDAPTFGGTVGSRVSVKRGQWETVCTLQCRTRTVVTYRTYDTAPPSLVVLEIDGDGRVLVSGLDTEAQHRKFYTNRVEVELERDGSRYVPARGFFARPKGGKTLSGDYVPARPNSLTIDGDAISVDLNYLDESHLGFDLTDELFEALKGGTTAVLEFNSVSFSGFGPVRFSLLGFTAAVEARTDRVSPSAEQEAERTYDPVFVVGSMISGNKFGLERSWLKVRDNPRGEGSFVYIPEMTIAGHKRWFIWFVHGRDAIALNGPSMTASPQLPAPLDVGYRFYEGTGLDAQSVTQFGLELIFE